MNDLLTHSHTDELSESEAALLFGGGPAIPAPAPLPPPSTYAARRDAAKKAILDRLDPIPAANRDAARLAHGWGVLIAIDGETVERAAAAMNRDLAD